MIINGKEYKLPKKFKEKWVAALRSGKYKQARKKMYGEGTYCCLAVAGSICGIPDKVLANKGFLSSNGIDPKILSKLPKCIIGASCENELVNKLVSHNDGLNGKTKKSFKWIASYIERYL